MNIKGHQHHWQISVNAWLALANYLISKALAVMFAEAVTISWWVDLLRGQSISKLHFRWQVGNSGIHTAALHWRLWSWICVGGLVFAMFTGLEGELRLIQSLALSSIHLTFPIVVLQQASSSATILSIIPRNMTAELASALPAGFSGVSAASGHDTFFVTYFTSPFIQVLQDYKVQSPVHLDLDGCGSTSNVSCATRLAGVGFQYTCNATRGSLQTPLSQDNGTALQPANPVFQVNFTAGTDNQIGLSALWQDKPGYEGETVTSRHCTLVPALVEYPINVTQRVATLQAPTSSVQWTIAPADADEKNLAVDRVLDLLPLMEFDKDQYQASFNGELTTAGQHSTLGGLSLAFSTLFGSSIVIKSDVTNAGSDVSITGSFAASYAIFPHGTGDIDDSLDNTYASPMNALISNIRDIMFRSSVAIATQKVANYAINSSSGLEIQTSTVPAHNTTGLGEYRIYHTVYKTNKTVLGIAVGLMLLAILAILPLYNGYWRLGRNVSLSPFEVAKALSYSTIFDEQTGTKGACNVLDLDINDPGRTPQSGSNLSADKLVRLLGPRKVLYGEVAPNVLGVGLFEHTDKARPGRVYD